MTQKVHLSFDRRIRNREVSAAIQYGGGSDGWISEAGTRLVEDSEGDLPSGDLGTFDYLSSSGLTVTIGAGEALVEGAYVATDETFDVDLDASTSNQTVYVGWRDGLPDTITVGLDSAFSADDHRIGAWEFDTDSTSVTASSDVRDLGQHLSADSLEAVDEFIDTAGVAHSSELAEASAISSIQSSSDVDHDSTTGGTSGNPHADSASTTDLSNHESATQNIHGVGSNDVASTADVSSIQSSADVNHDQTNGGTDGNPHANSVGDTEFSNHKSDANVHHQDPTAGTGVTDEGTNKFGIAANGVGWNQLDEGEVAHVNANRVTPLVKLEPGESYEMPIWTPPQDFAEISGSAVPEFYHRSAVLLDTTASNGYTTDANLKAEVLATGDSVIFSTSGVTEDPNGQTGGTASAVNGEFNLNKVRIKNTSTSTTFNKAFGIFGYTIAEL